MSYTNDKTFNILSVNEMVNHVGELVCTVHLLNKSDSAQHIFNSAVTNGHEVKLFTRKSLIEFILENFPNTKSVWLNKFDASEDIEVDDLKIIDILRHLNNDTCYSCGETLDNNHCVNGSCRAFTIAHNSRLFKLLILGTSDACYRLATNFTLFDLITSNHTKLKSDMLEANGLDKAEVGIVLEQLRFVPNLTAMQLYMLLTRMGIIDPTEKDDEAVLEAFEAYPDAGLHQLMQVAAKSKLSPNLRQLNALNKFISIKPLSDWLTSLEGFNRITNLR